MLEVERRMKAKDVIGILDAAVVERGCTPEFIRSDNGPEFVALAVQEWIKKTRFQNPLHQTRQSMAERLRREFPQPVPGRVFEPGSFRIGVEGQSARQRLPAALHPRASAFIDGLPDACRVCVAFNQPI